MSELKRIVDKYFSKKSTAITYSFFNHLKQWVLQFFTTKNLI